MSGPGDTIDNLRKVIVIGGSGLLGSYIVKKCIREGLTVLATHHAPLHPEWKEQIGPGVEWVQLDIHDVFDLLDIMEGYDAVINTAAIVSFNPKRKKEAFRLAREGTANIVLAASERGIKKLVHVSSVAALGRKKIENTISEAEIFSHGAYDTAYGLSKFLAEQEAWRGHFEGLPVTVINPSMVIGAGPWGQSSTRLITSVEEGLHYFPLGVTGFVDIRDVADAAFRALSPVFNGERFIISAENLPFETVFKTISAQLHKKTPWKPLTEGKAAFAWRWAEIQSFFTGKDPVITRDNAKSTSCRSWYDNTKSKDTLGLQYRNIQESIEDTCRIFLSSRSAGKKFDMLDFS